MDDTGGTNMAAVVKTLVPAHPVEFLVSSNIPFLDKNTPGAYSTCFQEDFQPHATKKAETVAKPNSAKVDHKDMRCIKEYLTEATVSYRRHPLSQITRTPQWTKLHTNFSMQTDPGEVTFITTNSLKYQPQQFQPPPAPIQSSQGIKKTEQVEKLPESTIKASFTPFCASPVVKATVKHLEEGFPTITGDKHHQSHVSLYTDTYQGAWNTAAQPVVKDSSVIMGDPVKIMERETTNATSFNRPAACSPPVVKEDLILKPGNVPKDSWLSTSKDDFCYRNQDDPVVRKRWTRNVSSLPKGDTDPSRNKERMSFTTNRIFFPDLTHSDCPVNTPKCQQRTKSHIQFNSAHPPSLLYTTTAKEHYGKKDVERLKPAVQQPSYILTGPEHGPSLSSTTKADFLPLKACKQTFCSSQKSVRHHKITVIFCFSVTFAIVAVMADVLLYMFYICLLLSVDLIEQHQSSIGQTGFQHHPQ